MRVRERRPIGWGSLSLLLILVGVLWSLPFPSLCIGDAVLQFIGVAPWSSTYNSIHYTVYYSLLFFVPALIIALKFHHDWGARAGILLSAVIGMYLLLAIAGIT